MVIAYRFIIGFIALLWSAQTLALEVSASIDKNPAVVDESLVLTVIAQDSVAADAFDPSSLQTDFVVGRTSISSQTSMVNWQTTRTTRWTTLLIPKQAGTLTIPALQVADARTQPIELSVLPAADKSKQTQKDVYITSQVSKQSVYVQQQFTLTVRLHFAAELKRGSIADPKMTGAEIRQIGENNEYSDIIDGRRFRIIERVYSVKPQTSGNLVLHSVVFEGEIVKQGNQRRSLFGGLNSGTPINVKGESIDITVKPAESNFNGEWLPSELIVVEDAWPTQQEPFQLGEPITRTVTITAAALSAEQLPELSFSAPDGLKIYPDQAESQIGVKNNVLISQKVQEFAIVPTQSGTFVIPELRIPWWNTELNLQEQAIIPSKTITVEGAAIVQPQNTVPSPTVSTEPQQASYLQWLFLTGWIATALAWLYVAKFRGKVQPKKRFNPRDKPYYLQLMAACKQNNGEQVLTLLPLWGGELLANAHIANLQQLLDAVEDKDLHDAVNQLQQCYYGKQQAPWQGSQLLKVISRIQTHTTQKQQVEFALNP
ncbi:BatD family protein [Thalassotalea maritima]|uniref:BatD family protein n=1 Tax=Thalassotalea maritima TaxID=3242416 RepID=UPI003527DE82